MTQIEHDSLVQLNRTALIQAHRTKDQEEMRLCSQRKEKLKRRFKNFGACLVCGVTIDRDSTYCAMHYTIHKFWSHRLVEVK